MAVFFSNGGLAPQQTNIKQLIPVATHSVPLVPTVAPLPPPVAATSNIVKTAKSHKHTFTNGALVGPQLE